MSKRKKKIVQFKVIYSAEGSKNRKFGFRTSKHLSDGYKAFVDSVYKTLVGELNSTGIIFEDKQKVWIEFTLYRTAKMTRTDSHNFIEAIADGIKTAIKVDDCWFSGAWDWQQVKSDPYIDIKVWQ